MFSVLNRCQIFPVWVLFFHFSDFSDVELTKFHFYCLQSSVWLLLNVQKIYPLVCLLAYIRQMLGCSLARSSASVSLDPTVALSAIPCWWPGPRWHQGLWPIRSLFFGFQMLASLVKPSSNIAHCLCSHFHVIKWIIVHFQPRTHIWQLLNNNYNFSYRDH